MHARAPLRIGLGGGGTDLFPFRQTFGGCTLSVTIRKYANATLGGKNNASPLVSAIKDKFGFKENIEISVEAPPLSGLGASAAIAVATIGLCLPKGTKIMTLEKRKGFGRVNDIVVPKNIGDIKVGDKVLSYNEKTGEKELDTVTDTMSRKTKEIIYLKLFNGNEIRLTPEHPIAVVDDFGKMKWINAGDVCVGNNVIQYKYMGLHLRTRCLGNLGKTLKDRYDYTDDQYAKIREDRKNHWNNYWNEDNKKKASDRTRSIVNNPNLIYKTDGYKQSVSESVSELWRDNDFRGKMLPLVVENGKRNRRKYNEYRLGKSYEEVFGDEKAGKIKNKMSSTWKKKWSDPEFAAKRFSQMMSGLDNRPTKLERELIEILENNFPDQWIYIGDGSEPWMWFNKINPDFIHNSFNKVIEVYDPYEKVILEGFEVSDDGRCYDYESTRSKKLNDANLDVIFITKNDLLDINSIREKILNFVYNPNTEIVKVVEVSRCWFGNNFKGYEFVRNNGSFNIWRKDDFFIVSPTYGCSICKTKDLDEAIRILDGLDGSIDVYNFETEKNHNYFAYGILVHNCAKGRMEKQAIADLAFRIEREDLKIGGGAQDQYASSIGGFNYYEYNTNSVIVLPMIRSSFIDELERRLVLVFVKKRETSGSGGLIQEDISRRDNNANLCSIKETCSEMRHAIRIEDMKLFGELLDFSWQEKKKLSPFVADDFILNVEHEVKKAGALGFKLSGAGGGGYALILCEDINSVREKIVELGLLPEKVEFDWDGLVVA